MTLIVFSLSRTKIFWYIVPVYPLLSISFAIVARRALAVLRRPGWPARLPDALVLLAVVYLVTSALAYKLVVLPSRLDFPQGRYGLVYAALDRAGLRRVETIDGGVANDDLLVDYTPQRRFYTLAWRARGFDIRDEDPEAPPSLHAGWVLVTCDPTRTDAVSALGAPAASVTGCAAVRPPVG